MNKNFKDFFNRVDVQSVKRPVHVKKPKLAHIIFVKQKNYFYIFFTFFGIFSTLRNTQTIKVIGSIFFSMSWP